MKIFRLKKGSTFFITTILVILVTSLLFILSKNEKMDMRATEKNIDLLDHPVYSEYEFSTDDSVINIGIQPLYLPTGIIFEVIKRDNILHKTLKKLNKKIVYHSFLKGADVNFFLGKNMLDGGVGGDMPALTISSAIDVIIPVILQKGNASIVSVGAMLSNDLKGKRIAYPYGSISHFFLLELLNSAGISEKMVNLIPMEVSQMSKALHEGKINLFSAWEPNVASAIKEFPGFFITYQQITSGYLYFLKSFVREDPEVTNHILSAVIRSVSWLKSKRENLVSACKWNKIEMEKLTGKKFALNEYEIADLTESDILSYYSKYTIVLQEEDLKEGGTLQREFEFLKNTFKESINKNWGQVRKSFNRSMILEIFKNSQKHQLDEYDYEINSADFHRKKEQAL